MLAMAKTTPGEFVRQVRQESSKVTWPTPRETSMTSVMVFIMVAIMATFFVLVDIGLSGALEWLMDFGG